MVAYERTRRGREWRRWDRVCPRRLAAAGEFVEGQIVAVIPVPGGYTPPASYEDQQHAYIVEWPAPERLAPLARAHGVFLGNDLLAYEDAVSYARRVLDGERRRALEDSDRRMRRLEERAAHALKRGA